MLYFKKAKSRKGEAEQIIIESREIEYKMKCIEIAAKYAANSTALHQISDELFKKLKFDSMESQQPEKYQLAQRALQNDWTKN